MSNAFMTVMTLLPPLLLGIGLGAVFFGGLWWTVCQTTKSNHVARLFLISFAVRVGVVLLGVYVLIQLATTGFWRNLLMFVIGFIVARGWVGLHARALSRALLAKKEVTDES